MTPEQYLRAYILVHKREAERAKWEWQGLLEPQSPACSQWHISSSKDTPSNPSQTISATGDQGVKTDELRRAILIQPTIHPRTSLFLPANQGRFSWAEMFQGKCPGEKLSPVFPTLISLSLFPLRFFFKSTQSIYPPPLQIPPPRSQLEEEFNFRSLLASHECPSTAALKLRSPRTWVKGWDPVLWVRRKRGASSVIFSLLPGALWRSPNWFP